MSDDPTHVNARDVDEERERIHVVKLDAGHEETLDCWCGPRIEQYQFATLVIHQETH